MQGVLAAADEILLALVHDCLDIGELRTRQYRNEHLNRQRFAAVAVGYLQTVARVVDIHLVAGLVLQMGYGMCLRDIQLHQTAECREGIASRACRRPHTVSDGSYPCV